MKRSFRGLALSMMFLLIASPASAIFDVSLMVAQESGTWDLSGSSSVDTKAASLIMSAHIDPVPLVPLAFGISLKQSTYKDLGKLGYSSLKAQTFSPEIMAWLPLGSIKPYLRLCYGLTTLKYTADVSMSSETTRVSTSMSGQGVHVGAGVKWSLVPLFAMLFEYDRGQEKISPASFEANGQTISPSSFDSNNSSLALGVEVGF